MKNATSAQPHGYSWVRQEQPWGCAAASMAALTGSTYQEVIDLIGGLSEDRHCSMLFFWGQWLAERGYALAYKHKFYDNLPRDPWPPDPFADIHVCEVIVNETSPGSHCVLMLADGSVLDPLTPEAKRLIDYHDVHFVAAVALLEGSQSEHLALADDYLDDDAVTVDPNIGTAMR